MEKTDWNAAWLGRQGDLGRWFGSITVFVVNALLQVAGFLILARHLGPSEFAVVVIANTVALVGAEFVGLGSGDLMIREVSRDPSAHRTMFGQALGMAGITLFPVMLVATATGLFLLNFHQPAWVMALLTLGEILFIRVTFLAEQVAIAHHRIDIANRYRSISACTRLATIATACFGAGVEEASHWSLWYVLAAIFSASLCMIHVMRRFGSPSHFTRPRHLWAGSLFSIMQIVRAVQFSIDKVAVAGAGSPAVLGIYGAASRLGQAALLPASAITRMTYPRFFEKGNEGLRPTVRYGIKVSLPAVLVGVMASAGLILCAFIMPFFLGTAYDGIGFYLLLLAPLPIAAALQNVSGDVLTGADHQVHRTLAATIGLAITAAATFGGLAAFGLDGAVVGYVVGQFAVVACLCAAIILAVRHEAVRVPPHDVQRR